MTTRTFPLLGNLVTLQLPKGAKIGKVEMVGVIPYLFVDADWEAKTEARVFVQVRTPKHVGMYRRPDGTFWRVYEKEWR